MIEETCRNLGIAPVARVDACCCGSCRCWIVSRGHGFYNQVLIDLGYSFFILFFFFLALNLQVFCFCFLDATVRGSYSSVQPSFSALTGTALIPGPHALPLERDGSPVRLNPGAWGGLCSSNPGVQQGKEKRAEHFMAIINQRGKSEQEK